MDPEVLGKANLIYGLFKLPALKNYVDDCWSVADLEKHGGDVVFLFGFLSRYQIVVSDDVLLHKRNLKK